MKRFSPIAAIFAMAAFSLPAHADDNIGGYCNTVHIDVFREMDFNESIKLFIGKDQIVSKNIEVCGDSPATLKFDTDYSPYVAFDLKTKSFETAETGPIRTGVDMLILPMANEPDSLMAKLVADYRSLEFANEGPDGNQLQVLSSMSSLTKTMETGKVVQWRIRDKVLFNLTLGAAEESDDTLTLAPGISNDIDS